MNEKRDFLKKCEELLYVYIDPFEVPGALEAIKEALSSAELSICEPGECLAYLEWLNSINNESGADNET